ncbi:hypothetical protein D3C72_1614950 [compost metagenome]
MVSTDSMDLIASSSMLKKSALSTARSASMPSWMRPFLPCSLENQALPAVHSSSAVSRDKRLPASYRRKPPTVRPDTSQYSAVHGL